MNRKKHRRFGFFLALAGLCFIPLQSAFALSIAYPREHDWTFHFLGNEYGIYEQKMDHGLLLSRPSNPSYSTYTRVMINGKQVWSIKSRFEWVVGGFFGVLIAGGILIGVGGGTLRQLVRDRAFNGEKKPEAIP